MNIHEFFEQLNREKIEAFIEEGREENLYLEFKTITNPNMSRA